MFFRKNQTILNILAALDMGPVNLQPLISPESCCSTRPGVEEIVHHLGQLKHVETLKNGTGRINKLFGAGFRNDSQY